MFFHSSFFNHKIQSMQAKHPYQIQKDKSINQSINSLLAPADETFDPESTRQRDPLSRSKRLAPREACQSFMTRVLYPSWQTRTDVLTYCAGVATSPDPDDPDHLLRENVKFQTYVDSLTAALKAKEKFYEKKNQHDTMDGYVDDSIDVRKDEPSSVEIAAR